MGAPTGVLLYEGVTWADVHAERFLGGWGGAVCVMRRMDRKATGLGKETS